MVNAPTSAAAACQRQPWPQRTTPSKHFGVACNLSAKSRPGTVRLKYGQVCRQPAQCSAVTRSSVTGSGHSSDGMQPVRCSGSSQTSAWSPANLAELLLEVSSRLVETVAALSLVTQSAPAHAGEIIQGMPRISDGDTLQVNSLVHAQLAVTLICIRLARTRWLANPRYLCLRARSCADMQINDQKIRLYGFDAPEKAQLCKNAQGAEYSCGV